ncbi:hypothetical protein BOTBODRAFT_107592, partial [Botryobasidium botryosum FD-172 SS1]
IYFMQRHTGGIHLALNGWTSPLVWAFLGLVIIWVEAGKMHRAILEFIRYRANHDILPPRD